MPLVRIKDDPESGVSFETIEHYLSYPKNHPLAQYEVVVDVHPNILERWEKARTEMSECETCMYIYLQEAGGKRW